jgi:hypothetical protein
MIRTCCGGARIGIFGGRLRVEVMLSCSEVRWCDVSNSGLVDFRAGATHRLLRTGCQYELEGLVCNCQNDTPTHRKQFFSEASLTPRYSGH